MGTTPRYGFPWPEETDPPDGPVQMRAINERVEAVLGPIDDRVTTAQTAANTANSAAAAAKANPQLTIALATNSTGLPLPMSGSTVIPLPTLQQLGPNNPFIAVDNGNTIRVTRNGVYMAGVFARSLSSAGQPAGASLQARGTGFLSAWDNIAQISYTWADVQRWGFIWVSGAQAAAGTSIATITAWYNGANAGGTLQFCQVAMLRVADFAP